MGLGRLTEIKRDSLEVYVDVFTPMLDIRG